jgi:hypothetical protein
MNNPYLAVFGYQIRASQADHAPHADTRNLSTDSYGKLFKRRRKRKACEPIGTPRPGTYEWKNDPKRYCQLLDASIESHDEHVDLVRKIKHGEDLPARVARFPLKVILSPFSKMVEMPIRIRKRKFNRRCVPCGFPKKKVWKTKAEKKQAGARKWSSFK